MQQDASSDPENLRSEDSVVNDCSAACERLLSKTQKRQGGKAACLDHGKSTYKGYVERCCKNNQFCAYAQARYDTKAKECVLTY